jgi:protein TonB
MMQITRREEPKPEPKPDIPKVAEVLDIVDDDVIIEDDFDFDMEADDNTEYDFTSMMGDDEEIEEDEIFYIVEDMPTFNGGDLTEFNKYIVGNLRYPDIAAENGISGRVIIQFMVDETGSVKQIEIVRSVDPALDKEAIRVVASSPKWIPGKQRGKPVKVLFYFPINFILQ